MPFFFIGLAERRLIANKNDKSPARETDQVLEERDLNEIFQ